VAGQQLEPRHALAVTPTFVGDINQVAESSLGDATAAVFGPPSPAGVYNAPEFVTFGGRTFFPADDGIHGRELWVSDGTPAGTTLLKDINATGIGFDGMAAGSDPVSFFVAGGAVYFVADDGVHGRELWKTDGTPAGTALVKDIGSFPTARSSSNPHDFARLADGTVLFIASEDRSDTLPVTAIWRTDGTAAGTVRLDATATTGSQFFTSGLLLSSLTSLGTTAVFARDSGSGPTLWVTDGTDANTHELRDTAGNAVGSPAGFGVVSETLTPPAGFGTPGTRAIAYFVAGGVAGRGLWRSDGTPAGTAKVADVAPVFQDGRSMPMAFGSFVRPQNEYPYGTISGQRIVFVGDDGTSGQELWASDGTAAGTMRLANINTTSPGTGEPDAGSAPGGLFAAGSKLFFSADDGIHGRELWTFDGEGVALAGDVAAGPASSAPVLLGASGATVFFSADDGVNGRELWKTDGGPPALVRDIRPGRAASFTSRSSYAYRSAAVQGGDLLFAADDGQHGVELWTSDGTAGGTALVRDIALQTGDGVVAVDGSGTFIGVAVIDGTTYFPADDGVHGTELWKRTGDAAPEMVADITPGAGSSTLSHFTVSGGRLFFTAAAPIVYGPGFTTGFPFSLWVTDGTAAGTTRLKDGVDSGFSKPSLNAATQALAPFGGGVIFAATDTTHGTEPWISDGTVGGTRLVADIVDNGATAGPDGDSSPSWFTPVGGQVYFAATDTDGIRQIWKTDGTAAGTAVQATGQLGGAAVGIQYPSGLTAYGGGIVFAAADSTGDVELWRFDGAATARIADINPAGSSFPRDFVEIGGRLLFAASDATGGEELWVTDGTAAGTRQVKDINPGAGGSAVGASTDGFFRAGSLIFFGAYDGTRGTLWRSDGTPEGTVAVPLREGVGAGSPGNLVAANGLLYFTADVGW